MLCSNNPIDNKNITQYSTSTHVEITIPRDIPYYPIQWSPVACNNNIAWNAIQSRKQYASKQCIYTHIYIYIYNMPIHV